MIPQVYDSMIKEKKKAPWSTTTTYHYGETAEKPYTIHLNTKAATFIRLLMPLLHERDCNIHYVLLMCLPNKRQSLSPATLWGRLTQGYSLLATQEPEQTQVMLVCY